MPTTTNRWLRWVCFGALLGLLLGLLSQPSIVQPASVEQAVHPDRDAQEVTELESVLFSWPPEKCTIYQTVDVTDFDVDSITGERYHRISQFRIDCPEARGASFNFGNKENSKRITSWSNKQGNFNIPIFISRITEEGFSWNFTPEHVDVKPGSVSNPSLLTSGGNATTNSNDNSASFSPTANALLVVGWNARGATAPTAITFTDTLTGTGSWADVEQLESVDNALRHAQGYAQLGASPGTGLINAAYATNTAGRKSWIIAEVTGHHTTTPLSESGGCSGATGTSCSIALVSIAAGNLAIGTIGVRNSANITFGANETELAEATSGSSNPVRAQMEYGTDATVNWTWAIIDNNAGVAIEYAQAAGEEEPLASQIIFID